MSYMCQLVAPYYHNLDYCRIHPMRIVRLIDVPQQIIQRLNTAPETPITVRIGGHACAARICIPNADRKIEHHYHDLLPRGLSHLVASEELAQSFRHFGVRLVFDKPTQIEVYDRERVMADDLRTLITEYGPVVIENAYLSDTCRNEGQRNIFPDLDFHFDRPPSAPNRFSLFCRDPFDEVQRAQRDSSTLIIPTSVAYLQQQREGEPEKKYKRSMYRIFRRMDIEPLMGDVILEQQWRAPEGVGEICLIDNRTVFHASYYRRAKGYPIGVRYLF